MCRSSIVRSVFTPGIADVAVERRAERLRVDEVEHVRLVHRPLQAPVFSSVARSISVWTGWVTGMPNAG